MSHSTRAHALRGTLAAVVLTAGAAVLAGCKSSQPEPYRPAPQSQTPVYSTPSPAYTQPAPAPAPRPATGGQMACGKGKCG